MTSTCPASSSTSTMVRSLPHPEVVLSRSSYQMCLVWSRFRSALNLPTDAQSKVARLNSETPCATVHLLWENFHLQVVFVIGALSTHISEISLPTVPVRGGPGEYSHMKLHSFSFFFLLSCILMLPAFPAPTGALGFKIPIGLSCLHYCLINFKFRVKKLWCCLVSSQSSLVYFIQIL